MKSKLHFGTLVAIVLLTTTLNTHAKKVKEYLPIVLVHGVLSDQYGMAPTEHYIKKHMGEDVYIKNVQLGLGELTSLTHVHYQAEYLRKAIQKDPKLKNGFNIIAHSQGGLVARYYVERYNNPRVINYISWGSPQQGVFGLPGTLDNKFTFLNYMENYTHTFLYSWGCQKYVGFAGYWHDTLNYNTYLKKSCLLPYLNNEVDHADAQLFKDNICKLKNMVLVMSHKEEIVEPRVSCHFGFYKKGSKTEIENLVESDIYKNDTLGLKTLDASGRLHLRYANCTHVDFQEDENNFVENTLEFLILDKNSKPKPTTPVVSTAQVVPTEEVSTTQTEVAIAA